MKVFEIKKLMVALVACLPIACGSSSPAGLDVAALEADFTASALRSQPGLPPTAPETPNPESVPAPETGTPTEDGSAPILPTDDDAGSVPPPADDAGSVPVHTDPPTTDPLPGDVGSVPAPEPGDVGAVPTPQPGNVGSIPPPQPDDAGSVPAPQPGDAGSVPVPPVSPVQTPNAPPSPQQVPTPGSDARGCSAIAAEIRILRGSLPQPQLAGNSVLLEVVMLGRDGNLIMDGSCNGVAWSFDSFAADAVITVSADTRHASVSGLAGAYVVRATTPNGQTATVAITLQ